jgi:hypothetical protein
MFHQFLQELESQLVLQMVEHVMHKVETQHLELRDSHSIWLHTAEAQLKVMDNLVHVDLEQITLQELAQEEADKATGRTHGAAAEAAEEQVEQENIHMLKSLTQEDILDTLADQETLQKDLQVEDQDGQTQTILLTAQQADVEAQVFTDLQAEEADLLEVLEAEDPLAEEMVTETTSELTELTQCQTLVQAAEAAEETQAVQESVKLPIG